MAKKVCIVLLNFFSSLKRNEIIDLFIVPSILTISIYCICNSSISNFESFIELFNSIVINTTAILSAFGMASLGMLISSSSPNIESAKKEITNRKDRNKNIIPYYKLQILRNFFSLFLLFGLLIYALTFVFLQNLNINLTIFFYIEVLLLIMSVFSQIFVVQSMYFLFVDPKYD